jgi:cytochrome c biogenesis protein CcmG, thiol:disulfide interchange protein DsbE
MIPTKPMIDPAPRVARRRFVLAVALSALACACSSAPAAPPPSAPSPLFAQALPDFQRRTLEGNKLDSKTLRGRVVVVKFFAKYCEPCKRTLPAVERMAKEHAEVSFVGIAEDERESDVREVVSLYGLSFPVIHDAGNVLSGRFRVREMPYTFVADAKGVVRWVGGPEQSEGELEQAIASVSR